MLVALPFAHPCDSMTGTDAAPVLACAQVPELNVQNGVLKALSFLFEYIGEMGKDYIYAVSPLLEDALMDRDLVHRQTAASVVQVRPAGWQPKGLCLFKACHMHTCSASVRCGVCRCWHMHPTD